MKKLLSIFGSLGMAGITGASVVACGDPKKEDKETTLREDLNQKINEVEEAKVEIDKNDNWGGIVDSMKAKLTSIITEAKAVFDNKEATDKEIQDSIDELTTAIGNYESSLPENIIATVIDDQETDTGTNFSKDWTYSSFWNLKDEKNNGEPGIRVMDIFYGKTREKAEGLGYDKKDADELQKEVLEWTQENVNLVYINVKDGKQAIKDGPILKEGNEDRSIEEIFLEKVREDFPDVDISNPEFWKENDKLSLGISFDKDAEGHTLVEGTKGFWTFTFGEQE